MNYGPSAQSDDNQSFFTAASGVDVEKNHTIEAKDDLNLNNWNVSANRNPRAIGSNIISFPNQPNNPAAPEGEQIGQNFDTQENLVSQQNPGEMTDAYLPQDIIQDDSTETPQEVSSAPDKAQIKTKERIDPEAVKIIEADFKKFYKDGNAEELYADIRGEGGRLDQNLQNSYNRELGKAA